MKKPKKYLTDQTLVKHLQEPPFAVQIELAEGCNLRCGFCGLNGIREPKLHNFKFMEPATLRSLCEQMMVLGWNPRLEFAMHGEPTMHPNYAGMIATARAAAPKLPMMMTSNGGGLIRKPGVEANLKALFDAGLNMLALDDYEGANLVPKIRKAIGFGDVNDSGERLPTVLDGVKTYEYPAQPDGNPHTRRKVAEHVLTFIQDISVADKGTHSLLNNHAGSGAPLNYTQAGKRCAKPFRELSVRWDGSVAVCCNDWRGIYKCGNVVTDGLDAVWNGAAMFAARQKLVRGERDFGPCNGCDAVSYRVGLLPDKMGRTTLPPPDEATLAAIGHALRGEPYTAPVKRPWELAKEAVA